MEKPAHKFLDIFTYETSHLDSYEVSFYDCILIKGNQEVKIGDEFDTITLHLGEDTIRFIKSIREGLSFEYSYDIDTFEAAAYEVP